MPECYSGDELTVLILSDRRETNILAVALEQYIESVKGNIQKSIAISILDSIGW